MLHPTSSSRPTCSSRPTRRLRSAVVAATVVGLVGLAGCGGAAAPEATPAPTVPPPATTMASPLPVPESGPTGASTDAPAPQGPVVEVRLNADGSVSPNGERIDVAVGEPVTIEVVSERDDELHVHGVDISIDVAAGETVSHVVTFDAPGSYEMESHEPARIVAIFTVR